MALTLYELAAADDARRFSPYCWRIRMALAHKGLDVETVPCRFTEKDAIAFSGQTRVPILVDGDRTITDSWAIATYLDSAYPAAPPLFGCAEAKALTRFVKFWDEKVLAPALFPLIILDIYEHIHESDKAYFRQSREALFGKSLEAVANQPDNQPDKILAAFQSNLSPLRETLRLQPFLAGDKPAFADYILLGRFQIARCMSPITLLDQSDPVYDWRKRMLDLFDGLAQKTPSYST